MNAVTYIRVSTPGQAEDGLGMEAQREACERIAAKHGFTVPPENNIVEQASGGFMERDGLDRVRVLVRTKQVAALVTYDPDRLARDEVWQAVVLREARDAGVPVYTLKGLVDTSLTGSLVNFVTGWAAALERDRIRQRTLDGKRAWAKRGVLPVGTGAGLYGYSYIPRDKVNKRPQARVVNEAEAAVVRRMFGMAVEGLGMCTIARILNEDGKRGKTGAQWSPWTIKNTLRNPAYAGRTQYGREATKLLARGKVQRTKRDEAEVIAVDGFTPPIVSLAVFERVQAHLTRPRRSGRAHKPYLLSGMLTCAACGTGLVGQRMNGGRYLYYVCRKTGPTATRPQECQARRSRAERLDAGVWTALRRRVLDPDFLYDRIMAHLDASTGVTTGKDVAEMGERIRLLSGKERNLVAVLRDAPSAASSITAELERVASERRALEREFMARTVPAGGSGDQLITKEVVKAFTQAVAERFDTMHVEERRQLLSLLDFEATVGDAGDVRKASIAVPIGIKTQNGVETPSNQEPHDRLESSFTTGRTWA